MFDKSIGIDDFLHVSRSISNCPLVLSIFSCICDGDMCRK